MANFSGRCLSHFAVLIRKIRTSDYQPVFALSEVLFQHITDVVNLIFNEHAEDRFQFLQLSVLITVEPRQNVYSVVEL